MNSLRFQALETIERRPLPSPTNPDFLEPTSSTFGQYVFSLDTMRAYLPKGTLKSIKQAIDTGEKITMAVAEEVAVAMKSWAVSKGASHYTHWFQPLTGSTAEKHDSFFELYDGVPMEIFSGSSLVQQEPDASSFPHGGIRSTFEARGYTAWDPSSPAFLMKTAAGLTLCIPTIFISYTGDALDYKLPLLRATHLLEKAALKVVNHFDKNATKTTATLGIEQEYFLVDEALYNARPDLMQANRTLLGQIPAKGQQLEDHYFGAIPERVLVFMADLEKEATKLGIPLRTRHNEVAPGQYECAPQFEEVNIAVDHNQLLMDLMNKIAGRHHLKVLLHEKPFKNVNGSGKHCNWSISTDTGRNLLSPGKTPKQNLLFLTFFINTIKAVHDYAPIMRASVAGAGNDYRLGAAEAPPAIISIFIGKQLTEVLDNLETGSEEHPADSSKRLTVPKVPEITFDNTDRNRTSSFAFTGNKFEFRAVGSSMNTSSAMIALNTAVAHQLLSFEAELTSTLETNPDIDVNEAAIGILKRLITESKPIRFEGNNYSDDWKSEALSRGLENLPTSPEAFDAFISPLAVNLFEKYKILSHRELEARYEIKQETYAKHVQIESRLLGEMVLTQVLPVAVQYQSQLLQSYLQLKEAGLEAEENGSLDYISRITRHINEARNEVFEMIEARKRANHKENARETALAYCHEVRPYFDSIRYHVNKLELYVDDKAWPLPKYRELLFIK